MTRIVIVDDQEVVRAGLARILGPADGFDLVAECEDGDEVITAVREHCPDLVLMDIRMARVDGIQALRELAELADPPPVLIITTFDDDDAIWGAIEAGAAGFALKDASAEELIAAAHAVAGGAAWFDSRVAPRVMEQFRRVVAPHRERTVRVNSLTNREHDVLVLMARGRTNPDISADLHVSEATVKSHVGSVFSKLGVINRAAAIVFAYDHGVVEPGGSPPP